MNHNFCRAADPQDHRSWCYTTDPNNRFDYCDCSSESHDHQRHQPMCHANAGTVTMPISFQYDIYDSQASIIPSPPLKNRIYGGDDANPGEVPWQVNLLFDGIRLKNLLCGGTLVSPTVRFSLYATQ